MPRTNQQSRLDADARREAVREGMALTIPDDHATAITNTFPKDLPEWNPELYALEIQRGEAFVGLARVRIGQLLLVAKAEFAKPGARDGGGYLKWLPLTGVSERTARVYMQVTRRAESVRMDKLLTPSMALRKLIDITSKLDDADIETLNEGGSVDGVGTLDEVERMSGRELRERVRSLTGSTEKLKKIVADKDKRLDDMTAANSEYKRQIAEGPTAPTDIEKGFSDVFAAGLRWAHAVKDKPRPERESALKAVMGGYDQLAKIILRALIPEQRNERPLPDSDHLLEEGGG